MKMPTWLVRLFHYFAGRPVEAKPATNPVRTDIESFLVEYAGYNRTRPAVELDDAVLGDRKLLVGDVDFSQFGPGDTKHPAPKSYVRDCGDLRASFDEFCGAPFFERGHGDGI
jgi:hypothetical protein